MTLNLSHLPTYNRLQPLLLATNRSLARTLICAGEQTTVHQNLPTPLAHSSTPSSASDPCPLPFKPPTLPLYFSFLPINTSRSVDVKQLDHPKNWFPADWAVL